MLYDLISSLSHCNPYLLALDVFLLAHFAFSCHYYCVRRGYKIDFWHFTLFVGFVLPFLILYPFAKSDRNLATVGGSLLRIQDNVDRAFLYTAIGYMATYAGFYVFNRVKKPGLGHLLLEDASRFLSKLTYSFIESKHCLYIHFLLAAGLSVFLTAAYFEHRGGGFDMRGYMLADNDWRPLFNLSFSYAPVVSTFVLVRYLRYRETSMLIPLAVLLPLLLPSGVRVTIFGPLVSGTILLLILKRKFSFARYAALAVLILLAAFYLGSLRTGSGSLSETVENFFPSIAYGNNFSDIRDFGWVLSCWDHEYLLGKSYAAALFSFVPRSFSDFRSAWSISIYTNGLLGFDSKIHPGLRPGKFGEMYLNFGIPGVILLGFVGGYITRFVDFKIKQGIEKGRMDIIQACSYTTIMSVLNNLYITASFWSVYVLLGILLSGVVINQVFPRRGRVLRRVAPRVGFRRPASCITS